MSLILAALKDALETDPSNWTFRRALVEAYWEEGQRSEARLLLNEIAELPEDEASLILAAQCWAIAGSTTDGREILQSVLQRNPANSAAHLALATIAHQDGDSQTALRHYITATSLDPSIEAPELQEAYGGIAGTSDQAGKSVVEETPTSHAEPVPHQDPGAVVPETYIEAPSEPAVADSQPTQQIEADQNLESFEAESVPPSHSEETESNAMAAGSTALSTDPDPQPEDILAEDKIEKTGGFSESEPAPEIKSKHTDDIEIDEDAQALNEDLKVRQEELRELRRRQLSRDKLTSLSLTVLIHVGAAVLLGLALVAVPKRVPPQIVAIAGPPEEEQLQTETMQRPQLRPTSAASASMNDILSVSSVSSFAVSEMKFDGDSFGQAQLETNFQPSMSLGDGMPSGESMMMFGQKIEGEVLGVILDVSGSMAEYLPLVIREVDRNLKNAPIVYVNHAGIIGKSEPSKVYPVIKEEVRPSWPRDWKKGNSPFWFLWGDLPRKAPQRSVDRLIDTFKTRPNMFIVRGGNNRIGSAAEFLISQKIDSLYIFSDFEDFVDEDYTAAIGQNLGRNKVRTYVQPAAARTEHLWTVTKKIARRSRGRELPPLTELLRPQDMEPDPIGVAVVKETPIPEGVQFATVRKARDGKGVFNSYRNYTYHKEWYGQILKIVEYPNFDIVLHGPEARAYIYMKNGDGYIQNPIVFGYRSYKPYLGSDERWHTRKRKFLRHAEEPKFENGEFTWKMILEDEILFEVIFWFKEDSATGTYVAEKPPNGEGDAASIFFVVPPMARESKDMYYSVDFPGGLNLDDLRLAMTNNIADFYLPALARDRYETSWNRLGFKKGNNPSRYNVLFRDLPHAVREVVVEGPSFGPRKLQARTTSNKLLLQTGNRADMELWEGFSCRLTRPADRRERKTKTEAIEFSVE